jgi:hypothetical protein
MTVVRIGIVAGITVVSGCAQLFGLDETDKDPDFGVSLAWQRNSIGATVVAAPQDLTGRTATYLVADDAEPTGLARVIADQPAADLWTADLRGLPAVQFDLPDFPAPLARQFEFASKDVVGLFNVFEHPNPTPGDPNAMLTVQVALEAPYNNEGLQLFTLGSWNLRGLEPPLVGSLAIAPPPFTFGSMSSLTGRPHEALTTADAVVALRYVGNDLTGFAEIPAFNQTATDTLVGTMAPNPKDQMLDIRVDQANVAQRYTAVRPAMANLSMSWSLRAAPGYATANDLGPLLNAAGVGPADPTSITVPFGNPFAATHDWKTTLRWATQQSRTTVPPGQTLPVTLLARMEEVHLPSPALELKLPAGLPELISFDATPLSIDGIAIPTPTRAVRISFVTNPAANTFYQVQLLDLVPNMAMTELDRVVVYAVAGSEPRFTLPPEVFVTGHYYAIRAISVQGGHPGIADGDLTQRELPFAQAFMDSGVFQVTP